jgi:hypothetical protein
MGLRVGNSVSRCQRRKNISVRDTLTLPAKGLCPSAHPGKSGTQCGGKLAHVALSGCDGSGDEGFRLPVPWVLGPHPRCFIGGLLSMTLGCQRGKTREAA